MSLPKTSDLPLDQAIFLGRDAEALSVLVAKQIEPIFEQVGIVVPIKSCSLLNNLADIGPASAADIAKLLGQSHQLILQKIPALLTAKLIRRKNDANDGRRKVFSLTSRGKHQLNLLRGLSPALKTIYAELYTELGVDLRTILERASHNLRERPLIERFDQIQALD